MEQESTRADVCNSIDGVARGICLRILFLGAKELTIAERHINGTRGTVIAMVDVNEEGGRFC